MGSEVNGLTDVAVAVSVPLSSRAMRIWSSTLERHIEELRENVYLEGYKISRSWIGLHCSVAFAAESLPGEGFLSLFPAMNLCSILKTIQMELKQQERRRPFAVVVPF